MRFSSIEDPNLNRTSFFSILRLLLLTYIIALIVAMFVVEDLKSDIWIWLVQSYAIAGAFTFTIGQTVNLKHVLLRFFTFLFGASLFGYFLRCIVLLMGQRNDDLGMATVLPLVFTIVSLIPASFGVWMLFVSIQIGLINESSQPTGAGQGK